MFHIALHFIVPVLVALVFYRSRWKYAVLELIGTMVVDIDHLLADPIYDPERCSIGFHPLHSIPAIIAYALLFVLPLVVGQREKEPGLHPKAYLAHLVGLGLLIHMALDWSDCVF